LVADKKHDASYLEELKIQLDGKINIKLASIRRGVPRSLKKS
jgi:hypothetical protein